MNPLSIYNLFFSCTYFKKLDCSLLVWVFHLVTSDISVTSLFLELANLSWVTIHSFSAISKKGVTATYVQDRLSHWSAELKVHRLHAFPWLHCTDEHWLLGFFAVKKICIYIYRWKWQKAKVIYKSFCLINAFSQPSISPVWTEE